MVWKSSSTLRSAFSLSPNNTSECWALEKYYLSHKKSLISWLFLMETFRPQTVTTVPKLQMIWAISSSKKQLSTARPKCLMWRVPPNGNCHWFRSIRCKMLLFEFCFRTCTWSFVLESEHTENNGTLEKECIVPNYTAVIWNCTFASIWNAALFCHPLFHAPAVRTLQLLCLN